MPEQAVMPRETLASPPPLDGWLTHRNWTPLLVVMYGTLWAVFAAFVVYRHQRLFASTIDVNGFGLLSRHLALDGSFSIGHGPTIRRAPLYPVFGAAILKLFGNDAPGIPDAVTYQPIILIQCLLFGLTCLVTWATTRRLFGPGIALLAAALVPLVPQSLRYIGETEVETATSLLIALMAYTGVRFVERPAVATGCWFGLAAAATTLTKPVTQFYPLVFLAAAWVAWYRARRTGAGLPVRTRVLASLAVLLSFSLPIAPWIVRNLSVSDGEFSGISSNAPGETLRGYVAVQPKYVFLQQDFGEWDPEANAYEETILAAHSVPYYRINDFEAGSVQIVPPMPDGVSSASLEAEKDRIEATEVTRMVIAQPAQFLVRSVVQLATFWYLVVDRTQSLVVGLAALGLLALAALGTGVGVRNRATVWPIVVVATYLNVIYASTLAMARYSMPLYPTLMVLAAAGLVSLIPKRIVRRTPLRIWVREAPSN